MRNFRKTTLYTILFVSLYTPFVSLAEEYQLLAPIGDLTTVSNFSSYVNKAILFVMGAGTGIAVLMIAIGGMQMIFAAGNPSNLSGGKEKIKEAIYGLVILALSALILETINPTLLNIVLI